MEKSSDPNNYIKNAQDLSSLVQDTPWCTKKLASVQLEHGDFYVFVDNNNKPHIAVKMNGNEIDEVRGLKNGSAQELEDDYRDVAIEFLSKNKDIKNGKEWLEKEEWNKRLIIWNKKIDEDSLYESEVEQLLYDVLYFEDYKSHGKLNSNKNKLRKKMNKSNMILQYLSKKLECKTEEIYVGDISRKDIEGYIFPYSVVIGNVNFSNTKNDIDMKRLKYIYGDADFWKSSNKTLYNLEIIQGSACFISFRGRMPMLSTIQKDCNFNGADCEIPNLVYVGGNFFMDGAQISEIPNLVQIGGEARFGGACLKQLPSLQCIGGIAYFDCRILTTLPSLNSFSKFTARQELCEYLETNFEKTENGYIRKNRITNIKR